MADRSSNDYSGLPSAMPVTIYPCIIHDQIVTQSVTPVRRPPPPHARHHRDFSGNHLVTLPMALVDTTNSVAQDGAERILPPSPDVVVDSLRDLVSSTYLNHDANLVHARAGALFARLKALNRAANVATRAHKQATADTRHNMDQTYLSLQNLLYEKRHLEREIEKCRQFA